jgi:hypothetical protein
MTITASATDRELLGDVKGGVSYVLPPAEGASYTVRIERGFDLELDRSGEGWTVVDRETGIYGAGATPEDALDDFRRAAIEHLEVLERQDVLSDELAAQYEYLRERLHRSA